MDVKLEYFVSKSIVPNLVKGLADISLDYVNWVFFTVVARDTLVENTKCRVGTPITSKAVLAIVV